MERRDRSLDVSVVGELNLDLILYGLPEELELEREHLADRLTVTLGSSSAIFAHNLATLGSRVGFISRIGADPLGRIGLERLASAGVGVGKVRTVPGETSTGLTVTLAHAGARHILTYPGTMFEMQFEDLDLDYLASAQHFHLSSFFLHRSLQPRIAELFSLMKQRGLTTSLDTNDDPEDRWEGGLWETLRYVDVFLPNEREARRITGCDDLQAAIARLASVIPLVVVKLGVQGALARAEQEEVARPGISVNCVDPVGAGDSFDAGFIHQYVQGSDLPTCLDWGNRAGAFSTTRPGGTEAFRDQAHFDSLFPDARGRHRG
jgi:sugar/nucleoside kinase (ribokinase family)